MTTKSDDLFNIEGKCIAITGGAGVLCGEMSTSLARRGAKVAVLDFNAEAGEKLVEQINSEGGSAVFVQANVLDRDQMENALNAAVESIGAVDVLINGAGGNRKDATCSADMSFFDLPSDALRGVFDLNCVGTILPSQGFRRHMAERGRGTIVNISSMCGFRPLTNVVGYSAAKAAVGNFTQWLATYVAQNCSTAIRVNAIAPGFFLTEQNRFLLTDKQTGELTPRGRQVIDHTPAGQFGQPADLIGTLIWLISDASKFVTGIVVPVDGGFSAYSGV